MDTSYFAELIQELISINFQARNAHSQEQLDVMKQDIEDCKDKIKDELFELLNPEEQK